MMVKKRGSIIYVSGMPFIYSGSSKKNSVLKGATFDDRRLEVRPNVKIYGETWKKF